MKINILILAAGKDNFNTHDGGYPFYLTELDGLSLLERIVRNTRNLENASYSFAFLDSDVEHFHLNKVINLLSSSATIVRVPKSTKGSACTSLLASSQLDSNSELLIISANELVDIDLSSIVDDFRERELQGGTLVFHSVHPRYSYVRLNNDGLVTEAAQQNPISDNATAGIFWFKKTGDFVEGAKNIIRKNASTNGGFFIAPVFNELILNHHAIGVAELPSGKYLPIKSERHMRNLEAEALV